MQVTISDDFDLQKIANSGQCFRVRDFDDRMFRFITGSEVLYIKELSRARYEVSCSDEVWKRVWVPYFDLERNYLRVREAIPNSDTYMQSAARGGKGIRILRQDPWETLVTFIISQRKSIPAIKASVELLAARFGEMKSTPYETLDTFPSAAQLEKASDQDLIDCKLGYRVSYVKDAVAKVLSGDVNLPALPCLPDTDVLNALKTVRGVGGKVASCVCLFSYGRTGVAPVDTWIHKIIACEYGGIDPFPSYGEVAGIMQQYAFYYAISHKERFSALSDQDLARRSSACRPSER